MKRSWFLALLAALLVLGAACGGGDDEGGDSDAGSKAGSEKESPPGNGGGGVSVTAVEYAFQVESPTVPAGETTFTFKNEGKEQHELAMVGIKEGAPPLEELVKLSDKEVEKYFATQPFGTNGPIKPGETTEFTEELKPGLYAMVCFVETDGKPHVQLGMANQLTVE